MRTPSIPPCPLADAWSNAARVVAAAGSSTPRARASSSIVRRSLRIESRGNVAGPVSSPASAVATIAARFFRDIGAAAAVRKQVDQPGRVDAERAHERHRLAERFPEHDQRQVHRELHGGASPDGAAALDAAAQLHEHRFSALERLILCTDQTDELAFPRGTHRATDRVFHHVSTTPGDRSAQRSRGFRTHGAHVNEQLALHVARQQSRRPAIDRVDRRRVREDGEDRVSAGRQLGRGGGDLCARRPRRLRLVGCDSTR